MAIVSRGFKVTIQLRGSSKGTSTLSFMLDSADYAAATADMATVATKLSAMTDAAIKSISLIEMYDDDTYAVPTGVQLTDIAMLYGTINGDPDKPVQVRVPGISRAAAVSDGRLLAATGAQANDFDISTAAVSDYWTLFSPGGPCTISDGERAGTLIGGKLLSRQSSNP